MHHQMKQLEDGQKYSSARRIFNSLLGVSSLSPPHVGRLPIVPPELSIFRLLLFLVGYPAGASAEERGFIRA